MRQSISTILRGLLALAIVAALPLPSANAAGKKDFKVAWSIYVGWMPWGYASDTGIVKKWADKYGINIEVKQFNDYVESINQYTAGSFDGIASIEMIEAVGEENWPRYFETLFQRLKPGASAVLQAITIPERYFDHYRRNPDFIQRYIFPGGVLPTRSAIAQEGARAGLMLDRELLFSASYAETLWRWLAAFRANWPEITKLGFDERFRRMWEYYLIYCATGFEREVIEVGLYRLTKPAMAGGRV